MGKLLKRRKKVDSAEDCTENFPEESLEYSQKKGRLKSKSESDKPKRKLLVRSKKKPSQSSEKPQSRTEETETISLSRSTVCEGLLNKLIMFRTTKSMFSFVTLKHYTLDNNVIKEMLRDGELVKINRGTYEVYTLPELLK